MIVRCLFFCAAWFELEVSTSDVRVAFMHAVASENKFTKLPVEQRAARALKEIQFERGKADLLIFKDPNPKQQ